MSYNEIFDQFEIEFDAGPDPIFHGGELITGFLKVNLKQQITINTIRLQFKGHAKYLGNYQKKTDLERVYFDKDIVLLERPPGWPQPGHFPWNPNFTYSLPFECPLPKGCPTSYESPFGFIRYYARCTFETNKLSKPTYYMVKKAFSIILPPELRQSISLQSDNPISCQDISNFGNCCCRGKIITELTLPKSTFVPGEDVVGLLVVDNKYAKYGIEQIEVRLIDRVKHINDNVMQESLSVENGNVNRIITKKTLDETNNTETHTSNLIQTKISKETLTNKPKKRVVKKYYKNNIPITNLQKNNNTTKINDHRVLFVRKLDKQDFIKSKTSVTKINLLLLTIPPVPSSIISDNFNNSVLENSFQKKVWSSKSNVNAEEQISKLLDMPSTATLRFRRQPFLQIDYAIQVSLGTQLLIEIPIQINSIPIYSNDIVFRPFAAGLQLIDEPDEKNKISVNGPFLFQPFYPTYLPTTKSVTKNNSTLNLLTNSTLINNNDNQIKVSVTENDEIKDKIENIKTVESKTTELLNDEQIADKNKMMTNMLNSNLSNDNNIEENQKSVLSDNDKFQTLIVSNSFQNATKKIENIQSPLISNFENFNDLKKLNTTNNENLNLKEQLTDQKMTKLIKKEEKNEFVEVNEQKLQNGHTLNNVTTIKNCLPKKTYDIEVKKNQDLVTILNSTEKLEYENQENCNNTEPLKNNVCTLSDVMDKSAVK